MLELDSSERHFEGIAIEIALTVWLNLQRFGIVVILSVSLVWYNSPPSLVLHCLLSNSLYRNTLHHSMGKEESFRQISKEIEKEWPVRSEDREMVLSRKPR